MNIGAIIMLAGGIVLAFGLGIYFEITSGKRRPVH